MGHLTRNLKQVAKQLFIQRLFKIHTKCSCMYESKNAANTMISIELFHELDRATPYVFAVNLTKVIIQHFYKLYFMLSVETRKTDDEFYHCETCLMKYALI